MKPDNVIKNTTCFKEHRERKLNCEKEACRFWINCSKHQNCSLIGAKKGPLTLQEIGDIFSVTRMRICQIEKTILKKVQENLLEEKLF
tara:strand:+ start:1095 stop:1358 length:264 start_codon:yes stop_codon:yes gene_type:complete